MIITTVILTYNEEIHIERAIKSAFLFSDYVFVVDSFSSDSTVDIAIQNGATVSSNLFINHASQFNWALKNLPNKTDWIFRLDADEYVSTPTATGVRNLVLKSPNNICGIYLYRQIKFLGKLLRFGGLGSLHVLRLFRYGFGLSETRYMDEHIIVSGDSLKSSFEIIDHNLNSLSFWINKHNIYSNREVLDVLNSKYDLYPIDSSMGLKINNSNGLKRYLKENIYLNLPIGIRSFLYFLYRYFILLGFLDGFQGAAFHFLQAFWYRYLVDLKIFEVKNYIDKHKVAPSLAIKRILNIDIKQLF